MTLKASPLTPDRWSRVAERSDVAATLPKDQRTGLLSSACVGDQALIVEIESLIAEDDVASPIDNPVWLPDDLLMQPAALAVGASLGPYVIEGVLGTVGMGEVYRAKDTKLGRRVLGAVVPFTLIAIVPTNNRLLDPTLDPRGPDAIQLLNHWGHLHATRSVLSTAAFVLFLLRLAA